MADEEHLHILQQGGKQWNVWREANQKIKPDLSHIALNRIGLDPIDLSGAELSGANLSGAELSGADLFRVDFYLTTLAHANLIGADLTGADLTSADLTNADLTNADLSYANLTSTNLSHTNFTGAKASSTTFNDLDLRQVKGLETIRHEGPSGITTSTLERSEGDIPEVFLREAGLSDPFIEYTRSLVQSPIQYYTCFISYSSQNQDFAERLYADLQNKGVRCWFAPEDMKTGDKIRHRIDTSIRLYDKLLLILSEASVASQWVEHEVETAIGKELEGRANVLFPVRLDDAVMQSTVGWASHIKLTRPITNFSQWKHHDAYQKSLDRLLRDLKADTAR